MSITLIVIILVAILILIGLITSYNRFIVLRTKIDEAYATMDIFLKKRYDLIPNLMEVIKGYTTHERETLERIVQARNMAIGAKNFDDRQQNESMITGCLKSLFAVVENYPQLKADTGFMNLQQQLSRVEEDISQSRKYYNGVVKVYNTKIEIFPSNLVGMILGLKKYPYFIINDYERQNVQVRF